VSDSTAAGLVLAGGYSTRFEGGDKALATLDGRPLLDRAVAGLSPAVDGVVVNCRRAQVGPFRTALSPPVGTSGGAAGVAFAPDPVPDRGPAAGLAAGLAPVSATRVAVVAVDYPFPDPALFAFLFGRLAQAGVEAAVPRVDGYRQPTHAVYRTGAVRAVADDGDGSLRAVLDRLDVETVPESEVLARTSRATFTDVNTRADLRTAGAERDE
jgi:molybdopterin-guanine dinucleotide biosynthesis protein A